MTAFPAFPQAGTYRITNAKVPACLLDRGDGGGPASEVLRPATPTIADGKLAGLDFGAVPADGTPSLDLDGGMVWPTCTDLHTHLDKGFIWNRAPHSSRTRRDAIAGG